MLENMDARNERENHTAQPTDRNAAERPVVDREVPLDAHTRADARITINEWLDGERSEAEARLADAKQVEFWSQVAVQTEQRRRMTTPPHVQMAIMNALPDKSPARMTAASATEDSRLSLTPLTAAAAAAGFTALGVLIGRVLGR